MPVVKISAESMSLLISEAQKLEVSVKDLLDAVISQYFEVEEEGEEEAEEEGEEEEEESEEEE